MWLTGVLVLACLVLSVWADVIICPDGTPCFVDNTCCQLENGTYGCCPYEEGVCCPSKNTCCPAGTECEPGTDMCKLGVLLLPFVKRIPARPVSTTRGRQDGAEASCEQARKNSCPPGYRSNPRLGTCDRDLLSLLMIFKVFAVPPFAASSNIDQVETNHNCADGGQCDATYTCCESASRHSACCPFSRAVCCEDNIHCCPKNTHCDLKHKKCLKGDLAIPWLKKVPTVPTSSTNKASRPRVSALGNITCPDGKVCSRLSTCCEHFAGDWACCPMPHAVCCKDHHHCCARDTICDPTTDKCRSHALDLPWQEMMPTRSSHPENPNHITVGGIKEEQEVEQTESRTQCPDGTPCTDNDTCCKREDIGQWGCCPLPHAVCCEDHEHCCPQFTKCDVAKGKCDDGKMAVPWFKKSPSLGSSSTLDNSPSGITAHKTEKTQTLGVRHCNDGQFCGYNQTCCEEPNGVWGCCPFPQAVCCKDHHHCCARDTICDPTTDKCLSHALDLPWQEMMPTRSSHPENPKHITVGGIKEEQEVEQTESRTRCPDGTPCPDNDTCCKREEIGQWGCCPLPHAVCCEDHEHCCPQFTKCDVAKEKCNDGKMAVPWFKKSPSLGSSSTLDNSPSGITAHKTEKTQILGVLHCNDGQFCGYNQTCCEEPNGVWGCCPFPQAICCKDHKNCCPQGTRCDLQTSKCVKGDRRVPDLLMFNNDLL